jgi:hypothetical protein
VLVLLAMGCSLDRGSEAAAGGAAALDPSGSGSGNAGQSGMASSGAGAGSSASSVASGAAASSGGGGSAGSGGDSSGPGGMGSGGAPLACWGPGAVCCGGVACAIGTHECCFPDQTQAESGSCVVLGTCPRPEVSVTCDDTEDCAGGACCTTWTGSQHVGMQCTSVAGCTSPGTLGAPGNYPMCNYPGGSCPGGVTCNLDAHVGDAGWGYCW